MDSAGRNKVSKEGPSIKIATNTSTKRRSNPKNNLKDEPGSSMLPRTTSRLKTGGKAGGESATMVKRELTPSSDGSEDHPKIGKQVGLNYYKKKPDIMAAT